MIRLSMRWAGFGVLGGAAVLAAACQDSVTSPAVCPPFCAPERIVVLDTVLPAVAQVDTSYGPYVSGDAVAAIQLVTQGNLLETRGILRFEAFGLLLGSATDSIIGVDSFEIDLNMVRRAAGVTGMEVALYRLPVTVDAAWTFDQLTPYLHDSLLVGVAAVDDTLTFGRIKARMPAAMFPTFDDDGRVLAVAAVLRSPEPAFLDLGTLERATDVTTIEWAFAGRFYSVKTGDTVVTRRDDVDAAFDANVAGPPPPLTSGTVRVGGIPSFRTLLRLAVPAAILDSASIVRATLLLVPSEPVLGAPGDTFRLRAEPLATDRGPKSPTLTSSNSGIGDNSALVFVGATDTVRIDITTILRLWAADTTRPEALFLRSGQEAFRVAELRFFASGLLPGLHVTYVPPFAR